MLRRFPRSPRASARAWLLAAALVAAAAPVAQADTIRVRSTTDTIDAGLLDGLLEAAYKRAQPGDTLAYVGRGTGAALQDARDGLGDVVITHAPSLEATFVADGYSHEPYGRAVFYSDYVIVGPTADPAGVLTDAPHDAITAFERIAAAGAAGRATFVSRGDNSGTNVQEQIMWGLTDGAVEKQRAGNAGSDDTRFEPSNGGAKAAWYERTNKGQAANLDSTNVCAYANGSCYTLVDRGTFNKRSGAGFIPGLRLVADRNDRAARGGENLLINPFSAYIVNPDKITTDPRPNVAAAQRFLDFLTSPAFQTAIEGFPTTADPAFRPDAFARLDGALPSTAVAGQTTHFTLTAVDRLPGGGAVDGLPVQLQVSTDGGATWTDHGQAATTDANGHVTLGVTLSSTAQLRVSSPRYRKFSPNAAVLGTITVPVSAGTRTPAAAPKPTVRAPAPRVTRLALTNRRVSLHISGAATVKITVARRSTVTKNGKRAYEYSTVKTLTLKATKAGTIGKALPTLRTGTYRVSVRVTAAGGSTRAASKVVAIRRSKG